MNTKRLVVKHDFSLVDWRNWRWSASGEDVLGLLLHQHGHVLYVATPEVQALLHTFDLTQ